MSENGPYPCKEATTQKRCHLIEQRPVISSHRSRGRTKNKCSVFSGYMQSRNKWDDLFYVGNSRKICLSRVQDIWLHFPRMRFIGPLYLTLETENQVWNFKSKCQGKLENEFSISNKFTTTHIKRSDIFSLIYAGKYTTTKLVDSQVVMVVVVVVVVMVVVILRVPSSFPGQGRYLYEKYKCFVKAWMFNIRISN